MTKFALSFLAVSLCLLPGLSRTARADDTVPVISLDQNGKEKVTQVSTDDYSASLGKLITTINDSSLAAIQKRGQTLRQESGTKFVWMLRDVTVGLGTNLTAGLSHIWSASFAPRVRFGFSNSTHPKIPD